MTRLDLPNPSIQRDQFRLWMAALKPPMYTVAIMPIFWGTALAYHETGQINSVIFGLFLSAAILILAWENISNDVFDAETGIDRNKHHSLVNLTQKKTLIFWIGNLCLGLGITEILAISFLQEDPMVLGLILLCCVLGYAYQGPPFRLGYQGLGEILCFFAFGPLGIGAVYYSQTQSWSVSSQLAGVILGMTTSLILFCSHFHQVEDDLKAGKRSPIVRLGTQRGAALLPWILGVSYALLALGIGLKLFPFALLLSGFGIIPGIELCRFVQQYYDRPEEVSRSKFVAVKFHFVSGILATIAWLF
ncbi:MAG: 2-carboxy-1,4-naphthoquinone phytyltransferase [Prochlorotrichaceae cyanobacterium]|jgi:1,4-dihydroxy-2-naphthoate octaprenyltransferase